jgi:hypothetical protein
VLRHLQPCPDCNAAFDGPELMHEDTCPLQAGVEAVCDEDRRWFIDHPDEATRTRPISPAELATLRHLDARAAGMRPDHVHVIHHWWGRTRTFCTGDQFASLVFDTDDEAAS